MRSSRKIFRASNGRQGGRDARGFALVEVGLALLILVLAFWLGLLLLGRARHHRRGVRFVADLQVFSGAFQEYRGRQGAWPASATGDMNVPRGMEDLLRETSWSGGSPFGGSYGWVSPGAAGRQGAITLTAFSPSFPLELGRSDLLAFDRRIDDGDLATGRFRTGFNGWPIYLVGEKP